MIGQKPTDRPTARPPLELTDGPGIKDGCANCDFGHLVPNDLKQKICAGLPPQALALPAQGPGGQMGIQIQFTYPLVKHDGPRCSLWVKKGAL